MGDFQQEVGAIEERVDNGEQISGEEVKWLIGWIHHYRQILLIEKPSFSEIRWLVDEGEEGR